MKRMIRTVAALLLALCLVMGATAYASEITSNGVSVGLTTDRDSYNSGDSVLCTLNVSNTGEQEISLAYDTVLPEGLQPATGEKSVILVGAGEETSGSFLLQAVPCGADQVPNTGDSFPVELLLVLFAAAFAAALVLCRKNKRMMLFMLVFVMLFGMAQPALVAAAEEVDPVTDEEGIYLPEIEEPVTYPEDAFQESFEDEDISEDDHLLMLDEAEIEALARELDAEELLAGEVLDQFTLKKTVMLDGQLVTIAVNVTLSTGGDDLADVKATLKAPNVKPITVLGVKRFRLNWSAVKGATHYEVWHKQPSGKYLKKTTTTQLTYYTNYGRQGYVNTYKVRAIQKVNGKVVAKSGYTTRSTYGMAKPTISKVAYISKKNNHIRLSWKAASFCTGYNIYRSYSGKAGTYKWIGKTTALSYVDKYHNAYYKIRPYYVAKNGATYSGPASAMANMANPFDIITQPADTGARKGTKVSVSVKAMGKDLTYTWYYADKGKTKYQKSKIKTNTYTTTMKPELDGRKLYCVVTDASGRKRTTKTVKITLQSDYTYTITGGKCYITAYLGVDTAVAVPATMENCPVVAINANAFKGNTKMTSVTLPASVTSIGDYAFEGCTALKSVTLSNGVKSIGRGAFKNCSSLNSMITK